MTVTITGYEIIDRKLIVDHFVNPGVLPENLPTIAVARISSRHLSIAARKSICENFTALVDHDMSTTTAIVPDGFIVVAGTQFDPDDERAPERRDLSRAADCKIGRMEYRILAVRPERRPDPRLADVLLIQRSAHGMPLARI